MDSHHRDSPLSCRLCVSVFSEMKAREEGGLADLRLADDGLFPDRGLLALRSSSRCEAE